MSSAASEAFTVQGEDRPLASRAIRWVGTVVAGLLDANDAPAMSDVVIRSVPAGIELQRIEPASYTEFSEVLAEAHADLERLDVFGFAEKWLPTPGGADS